MLEDAFLGLAIINISTDNDFNAGPILQVLSGSSLDSHPEAAFTPMDKARVIGALYVGVDSTLVQSGTIQRKPTVDPPNVVALGWHPQAVGKKDAFIFYDGRTSLRNVQAARKEAKSAYTLYHERDPSKRWRNTQFPTPQALATHLYMKKGRWLAKVYDKSCGFSYFFMTRIFLTFYYYYAGS